MKATVTISTIVCSLLLLFGGALAKAAPLSQTQPDPAGDWARVQQAGKLVIGTSADYPPFEFYNSNYELDGFDIALAKAQGISYWMAMAMMVPTRLWLGGVVSAKRDKALIQQLGEQIRAIALCRPLLLAVDGLASYVSVFQSVFRSPLPRFGQLGRPKLVAWQDIAIVQVVKQRTGGTLRIDRRIVQGAVAMIDRLIHQSQGSKGVINTAYIERLNATFRQRIHWLTRRSRSLAQQAETLSAGMFIVGTLYNFCDLHQSLRCKLWITERRYRWVQRTPAMAAQLTDHQWSVSELFWFRIPPPRWVPPVRRGRPSNEMRALIERWA